MCYGKVLILTPLIIVNLNSICILKLLLAKSNSTVLHNIFRVTGIQTFLPETYTE